MFLLQSYLVFIVNLHLFTAACCQPQTNLTFLKLYFDQHLALSWIIIKLQVHVLYNNAWFGKVFTAEWFWFFLYSLLFFFKNFILYRLINFSVDRLKIFIQAVYFHNIFHILSFSVESLSFGYIIKAACFAWTPNNLAVLTLTSLLVINFVFTLFCDVNVFLLGYS